MGYVKNKLSDTFRDVIEDIYATPNLEVKPVSSTIPLTALDFIEKYKLRPRDAFHLAVMQEFRCNHIVSDDADFDKIPTIKRIRLE